MCAIALVIQGPAVAYEDGDPRETIATIDRSLAKAAELLRASKPEDAAAALAQANVTLATLKQEQLPDELRAQVERLGERLAAAERLIAKSRRAATKSPDAPVTKPPTNGKAGGDARSKQTAKTKGPARPKKPAKTLPVGPSFAAEIAPILMARCGNCHVRQSRGGLSMATFAALEKGAESGPVLRPGASDASRLVEMIASGAMPRGGGRVSPEELLAIARWIDAGALFDGADRTAPLANLRKPDALPKGLAKATGAESVQFNRDLAPLLVANCIGCHGGDQPTGQLRLETFGDLLKGGASGAAIEAGKPAESLLIKRLRGIDGERMPQEKPPLAEDAIKNFETWIREGAKFDGADPAEPLKVSVEALAAGRMSPVELAAKRLAQAQKIWRLAVPDEQAQELQTVNFIVLGNVSAARAAEIADLAEAERAKIAKFLKLDADAPLVKGSLVLFVFKRSFDYSEFVRMIDGREAPRGAMGHWRLQGSDAYACLAVPTDGDANLAARVAEQIAGAYLQSLNNVPAWFAAGAARAIAARVEPKNPLVKQWDAQLQHSTSGMADAFLSASVFDNETAAASYAFVRFLMTNLPRFQALAAALAAGDDFSQSLENTYRANARTLVELWLRRQAPGKN
jgi:hypothetical protein